MTDNLNTIFALSRRLTSPEAARGDMRDAANLVTAMLRERYVDRIRESMTSYMDNKRGNPSKELNLLNALKPFLAEDAQAGVDRAADMLIFMDALKELQTEGFARAQNAGEPPPQREILMASESGQGEEDVIHVDGVYELDRQCLEAKRKADAAEPGAWNNHGWFPGVAALALFSKKRG